MNAILFQFILGVSSVLFVGNSYTMAQGGQWSLVKQIYDSVSSDTLVTGNHTIGGATFQNHWENTILRERIETGNWTCCVFQEQSCMPVIDPDMTFQYGDSLALLCFANETQPAFFMTWARKNDPLMLQGLSDGYSRMGYVHSVPVSPCGIAFEIIRRDHPEIDPYSGDGAHPSLEGSYLAACVIAATVLGVDLEQAGIWHHEDITPDTAVILREAASEACSIYIQPSEALR